MTLGRRCTHHLTNSCYYSHKPATSFEYDHRKDVKQNVEDFNEWLSNWGKEDKKEEEQGGAQEGQAEGGGEWNISCYKYIF